MKIIARQQWPENEVYELAISAQCVGAAFQGSTLTQVLNIQVLYKYSTVLNQTKIEFKYLI